MRLPVKRARKSQPRGFGMKDETDILPLLPLREGVLLPGGETRIYVGRPQSLDALQKATAADKRIFCIVQRDGAVETPQRLADFAEFGTLAKVISSRPGARGTRSVLLKGLAGARLVKLDPDTGMAEINPLGDVADLDSSSIERCFKTLARFMPEGRTLDAGIILGLKEGRVGKALQHIIGVYGISPLVAAELIGEVSQKNRLERIVNIVEVQHESGSIREEMHARVKQRIRDTQREYVLREILRDVKGELGVSGSAEEDDLSRVALSAEARQRAERELKRLEMIPPMSPEYGVIRGYLEWLRDLPWGIASKEEGDIRKVRKRLEKSHYGLEDVKRGILEFVAARRLAGPKGRGSILCLVGPPGTGKTSLAMAIAEALGRKFVRISLGGMRDEAEIRGHRRTYVGAMPGRIIQQLRKIGSSNPVFLLDEIDKLGNDYRGNPAAALLEVLDPEINGAFQDHYLEVEYDLSQVFFVTTANSIQGIPRPLADRMDVIHIPGYTEAEKRAIALNYLVPRQFERNGIQAKDLEILPEALDSLISSYTREAGVRGLEREIQRICRKKALAILEKKCKTCEKIGPAMLHRLLGKPRYKNSETLRIERPGLVHGLAWTEVGGQVLDIEARYARGQGRLVLTGKLGTVMQESAQTALSLVRFMVAENGTVDFATTDFHVHVPEAATPKDGPSAGITIACAILSALRDQAAPSDTALTGEVTLLGRVLPIGGLKEKILAAKRLGIRRIILPEANRPDLEELDKEIRKGLVFIPVRDFASVVQEIFYKNGTLAGQQKRRARREQRKEEK